MSKLVIGLQQIVRKTQRRARNARGNPLTVALNVGVWGLIRLWSRTRITVNETWLSLNARLRDKANYSHEGISLSFKLTSGVELQRVRNKGQPFVLKQIFSHLQTGSVYYDVGANIGIFALPAARIVGERGQVVAFEPDAANYHRLCENIEINRLTNMVAFGAALGSANKISMLYRHTDRVGEGGQSLTWRPDQKGGNHRISVSRLDDLIALWALPAPNLIKIDVDNDELQVLNGMPITLANPELRAVICEVLSLPDYRGETLNVTALAVCELLATFGFEVGDRALSGDSGGSYEDILFVKT